MTIRNVGSSKADPSSTGVGLNSGLNDAAFEDHRHPLWSAWENIPVNTGLAGPCRICKSGDLVLLQFNLTGTPNGGNLFVIPEGYRPEVNYRSISGLFWPVAASQPTDCLFIIPPNNTVTFAFFNNAVDSIVRDRYHLAGGLYRTNG